jgi:hypothetical protein
VLQDAGAPTHRTKLHKEGAVAFRKGPIEEAARMVEDMERSSTGLHYSNG